MLALGFSREEVKVASRQGRLHRVHRGVYAVGHQRLSPHGHYIAAVLACGPDALLSHNAAGWIWGLLTSRPSSIDVTVPTRGHRRAGVRLHFAPSLGPDDRCIRDGISSPASPARFSTLQEHCTRDVWRGSSSALSSLAN
jgi:hypothetical protein